MFAALCDSLPLTPVQTSADNTSHPQQNLSLGMATETKLEVSSFVSIVVFLFLIDSALSIKKAVFLRPSFPTTSP